MPLDDIRSPRSHLTEAEVQHVIARALQLDAHRADQLSVSALEHVADDLGISPEALAQAVAELEAARPPVQPLHTPDESRGGLSAGALTVLICAGGFLIGTLQGQKVEAAGLYLMLASAGLAMFYRGSGHERSYYRHIAAGWIGYGLGWFVASGLISEGDTTFHLTVPGLTAMALGWLVLTLRAKHLTRLARWLEPGPVGRPE
jgi:hypothetical protein